MVKENDCYTHPAYPANTHDPYADNEYGDNYDTYDAGEPADCPAPAKRSASRLYNESPCG